MIYKSFLDCYGFNRGMRIIILSNRLDVIHLTVFLIFLLNYGIYVARPYPYTIFVTLK